MVTGISSGPWGYSTANVAGLRPSMEIGYHPLTYEESLTSYPPSFNRGRMISPISIANRNYYKGGNLNFGKKNINININKCRQFLESNGTINPLSGRKIIIYGPTWKYIMDKCVKYSLIKESLLSTSSLPVNYIATKTNVPNKLFIGNMPESPEQHNINSLPIPRGFKVTRDSIYLNGKIFNLNDTAKIYADGTVGTIIKISPKQIVLSRPNTLRHRHLKYKEFKELNK